MTTTKQILDYINELYPLSDASDFDRGKIGLQFGSPAAPVEKVMLALDTTMDVIDEAIKNDANLIISHHSFMFQPLLNLNYDSPFGKRLMKVMNHNLNIMSFHTNYDVGKGGMNEYLAGLLDVKLEDVSIATKDVFLRVGEIEPLTLEQLCQKVKKVFNQKAVRYVGDLGQTIKKIGIVGGAGGSDFYEAMSAHCDCYITGQIPHFIGFEALDNHIALIEVSHAVEFLGMQNFKNKLEIAFPNVTFLLTSTKQDPFQFI